MPTIAIVYHSGYGHTQRMAQAVADGSGGHVFAETLDEHNANVRRWRKAEAEKAAEAAKAATDAAVAEPAAAQPQ